MEQGLDFEMEKEIKKKYCVPKAGVEVEVGF